MSLTELRARRGRMTEDLAALVAVESPSADDTATAAGATAVTALAASLIGAAPERTGNHLVWRHGPTRVLLLGHLDTVWPVGTLARWPFSVAGDTATGPGCFDMKAGLVQLFHALSMLPSLDGVTVVVNADEEIGSPVSRALIERAADGGTHADNDNRGTHADNDNRGTHADNDQRVVAALVCEPSLDGALKTARKGIARYRLDVTGRAAHTGLDPARGVNAGLELAHQTIAVAALGGADTTVTPTVMQAGTTENTVPAAASLAVDVRAFHDAEFDRVDRAIHALRPVVPGARLTVRGHRQRPALPASASARLFRLALDVAADLGLPALAGVPVGGASDGNLTAGLGVPTLDGLGAVGGNAHAEGEWVDLAAMGDRAALLAALVTRILDRPA